MDLLLSGVQLSSDVIGVLQSKGTILKISIKVPGAVIKSPQSNQPLKLAHHCGVFCRVGLKYLSLIKDPSEPYE